MIFTETPLPGAFVIDVECHHDERGLFGRTYCTDEFQRHAISMPVAQCNVSYNLRRGTLRGMHFQIEPAAEAKLVRCTRGAVYDAIVDIRRDSEPRARIPDARGQHGSLLSDVDGSRAAIGPGDALERSPAGHSLAVAGLGDFVERCEL
jgi:hypothetical protein